MSGKRKETLLAAGFLMPVFIVYTVFLFVPLVNTAMYSLTKWNGVTEKVFIGIRNYQELFHNADYWITFQNTIKLVVITLVIQIPTGLLLAYLLYIKTKGSKVFRTIFFLPVVIAPVAIALMFSLFYNSEIGVFNRILEMIGLDRTKVYIANVVKCRPPQNRDPLNVEEDACIGYLQYIGLYVTIFLGALQAVPEELVESAEIDGAGKIRTFFYVVLPQIVNFTNICVILCVTGSLKAFEHSWIMTGGGPGVRSAYLGVYMYKTAFVNSDFGTGSAITMTIVALSLAITGLINGIGRWRERE